MLKRGIREAAVLVAAASLTGCYWSGVMSTPGALKEQWQGRNGEITVIKGQTKDDPYHELQRYRAEQKTLRLQIGGKK